MKLSELSTDRALDVLCELTPHVSAIASDEAVVGAVGKVMDGFEGLNRYGQYLLLAERVGEIVPVLLKNHRADVYGILSVVNEKAVDEIKAQPLAETVRQIREALSDSDLLAFFKSSARPGATEPSAPSADSPACV